MCRRGHLQVQGVQTTGSLVPATDGRTVPIHPAKGIAAAQPRRRLKAEGTVPVPEHRDLLGPITRDRDLLAPIIRGAGPQAAVTGVPPRGLRGPQAPALRVGTIRRALQDVLGELLRGLPKTVQAQPRPGPAPARPARPRHPRPAGRRETRTAADRITRTAGLRLRRPRGGGKSRGKKKDMAASTALSRRRMLPGNSTHRCRPYRGMLSCLARSW